MESTWCTMPPLTSQFAVSVPSSDEEMEIFIESNTGNRHSYRTSSNASIWPFIQATLHSTGYTIPLSMPVHLTLEVSGCLKYQSVVVDLIRHQPEATFRGVGATHGSLLKLSGVHFTTLPLFWPVGQSLKTEREVLGLKSHEVVVWDGWFSCDFQGCKQRTDTWKQMEVHFMEHDPSGLYLCPHYGCGFFFNKLEDYERHTWRIHGGMRLPRIPIPSQAPEKQTFKIPLITPNKKRQPIILPTPPSSVTSSPLLNRKSQTEPNTSFSPAIICPICLHRYENIRPWNFATKQHLKRHIYYIHAELSADSIDVLIAGIDVNLRGWTKEHIDRIYQISAQHSA